MPGVTTHDPGRAWEGYTLFSETFSRPAADGEDDFPIYLIDMEGRVVHTWTTRRSLQSYCRLLPDGNLLVPTHDRSELATGRAGLAELAPDSEVVWSFRCRTDHDFQVLAGGNLLINTIGEGFCPPLGPGLKRHPYIIEVTRDQDVVWEWRGEEHLEELQALLSPAGWQHVLDRARGDFAFDWAHNNTVQVIGPNAAHEQERVAGGPERFRPGNFLISYRSNDVIAVVERPSGRIVWAWGPGELDGQHKPHMLPTGRILIFDNGTLRKKSRVIELDPLAGEITWEYTGQPDRPFFSHCISGAQRLPNGNTLICDGVNARLVEVTPQKDIVWEFVNPYRHPAAWEAIYRCLRYSGDYVQPLLDRAGA